MIRDLQKCCKTGHQKQDDFCQLLRHCGSGDELNLRCISVTIFCLFCVVQQHGLKIPFYHHVKENLCHFSTDIPAFFLVYYPTRTRD